MQIAIDTAKYPQLMGFAKNMGLEVSYGVTKLDEVRELIRTAYPGLESIEVSDNVESIADNSAAGASTHYRDDPKVTVNIASDPINGGNRHFPITVGNDLVLVKRDTPVPIPYRHFLALMNAVETVMTQESHPITGKLITVESDQNAVRFSVLKMPTPDEIDAFHERTRSIGISRKKAA
jgi:hypothetical protein